MAGSDHTDDHPTPVTIFGRTYPLRGGADPDYLIELAALVDARMREVAEGTGTADSLKVAILAALNIADDFLQASRRSPSAATEDTEGRLGRLVTLLDEALAG
jgi:cell division protein ZapA